MKKSMAWILSIITLFSLTIPATAKEPISPDMQLNSVECYIDATYSTNPDGSTSVLFQPSARTTPAGASNAIKEASELNPSSSLFTGTPRASSSRFINVKLLDGRTVSKMTFTCEDVVFQPRSSIVVTGTADKIAATLSAEVYRKYNGEWVRVGVYPNISGSNGKFSFTHPIGADGDYGIQIWHDLPNEYVYINGNLIY